jgi:3-dehydroquinate dehydratase/shikimate dehydrogenase
MPRDGGRYRGSLQDRIALLDRALQAGARGIDLEDWETWSPRGDAVQLLIRSHHDLRGVPAEVLALRDQLLDHGADVAKIVGRADDLADAAPLMALLGASDPKSEPTIAFATGAAASVTRVLSAVLGAPFVYASLAADSGTAPGQIPVADLVGVYGVKRLGPTSAVLGLLGDPALHSLGPWVHNRALRAAGVEGVYLPFETKRPREVLQMLPRRRLRGLSVTAPHKEAMLEACHRLSAEAEAVRAVNTLTFEAHDAIVGHNTDVAGVEGALRRAGCRPEAGAHGAVLGGGGAARAAALALERMGMRVTILARTLDGVRAFARERGYRLGALRADVLAAEAPQVVVHATPVGSAGHPTEGRRLLPEWRPEPGCAVLDMVYRPRWTALLRDVRDAGGTAVPGIEMFLTQAAEQLGLFLGSRVDEDELRRFLAGWD